MPPFIYSSALPYHVPDPPLSPPLQHASLLERGASLFHLRNLNLREHGASLLHKRTSLPPGTNAPPQNPDYHPGALTIPPEKINNHAYFALFALLGVSMVLASIWFFFWARNGGFHFRRGDWDEYKSTVLRRKGPNGTTLSGATKSTKLGGGSIVADLNDDGLSSWGGSSLSNEIYHEKMRSKQTNTKNPMAGKKATAAAPTKWKRGAIRKQQQQQKQQEKHMATPAAKRAAAIKQKQAAQDADVRAYRHEKPARVGGLNRLADGMLSHEYSPYTSDADSPRYSYPVTPKKTTGAGVRQVHGTPGSGGTPDSSQPLRRSGGIHSSSNSPSPAGRRNRASAPAGGGGSGVGSMPGAFTDPLDFDSGPAAGAAHKSYASPLAGLSGNGGAAAGGFRRGRVTGSWRDELSDSGFS